MYSFFYCACYCRLAGLAWITTVVGREDPILGLGSCPGLICSYLAGKYYKVDYVVGAYT